MSGDDNGHAKWSRGKWESKCKSKFKSEFHESRYNHSDDFSTGYRARTANGRSGANQPNTNRSGSDQSCDGDVWHAMPANRYARNCSAALDVKSDEAVVCKSYKLNVGAGYSPGRAASFFSGRKYMAGISAKIKNETWIETYASGTESR